MNPVDIVLAAWLAVNVLTVLVAMNWAASRKRAFRNGARQMVDAAERHANAPLGEPVALRAPTTRRPSAGRAGAGA
jgi:hypothetical protein